MTMIVNSRKRNLKTLPAPGQILVYDFRRSKESVLMSEPPLLKCVQWNIERGYELDLVIEMLKEQDADVICLQELDIGCERSAGRNCAWEIAHALEMKCAMAIEYVELHSPLRTSDSQGGGVHGNAIISKWDFEPEAWPHEHQPVNWDRDGSSKGEPRSGCRVILAANLQIPGLTKPVRCYSLHLEVFCGLLDRVSQFEEVLRDADDKAASSCLIFGDLNTMAHGIARLSPKYCRDRMRWASLGWSEAQWFQQHLIGPTGFSDPLYELPTLHSHWGWYEGKLDWMLMRGVRVHSCGQDNQDYAASDHQLLWAIIRPHYP